MRDRIRHGSQLRFVDRLATRISLGIQAFLASLEREQKEEEIVRIFTKEGTWLRIEAFNAHGNDLRGVSVLE
jgi:hypothetical protein